MVVSAVNFTEGGPLTVLREFVAAACETLPLEWNIVVLYLFVMHLTQQVNTIVLLGLAALVFVPIRYLYPTRTPTLRWRASGPTRNGGAV